MRSLLVLLCLVPVLACSGTSSSNSEDASDASDLVLDNTVGIDAGEIVCTPDCQERVCGTDGCGGSCGDCAEGENCGPTGQCGGVSCEEDGDCAKDEICHPGLSQCGVCVVHSDCDEPSLCEAGLCVAPVPCGSGSDCPEGLYCEVQAGRCVECSKGSECSPGNFCGGDNYCHSTNPCGGDGDCDDVGFCDKSKGLCVGCLGDGDCPDWENCKKGACATDDCWDGLAFCQEEQIVVCKTGGKGFTIAESCGEEQFCADATCIDIICEPGSAWCDGSVRKVCDEFGGALAEETDCTDTDENCVAGECTDLACLPDTVFCVDDFTTGNCAADGQSFATIPCSEGEYCEEGSCFPQVCLPNLAFCEGQLAVTCNANGSEETTTSCGDLEQGCVDGECVDFACDAGQSFCLDSFTPAQCSADGYSYVENVCPEENYCDAGFCFLWKCEPSSLFCEEELVRECAEDGSSSLAGTDCGAAGKFCYEGTCVDCLPSCDGLECGADGCGGVCGVCEGEQFNCQLGLCVCTPNCDGKECGTDLCEGSCGECVGLQEICEGGMCVCQPFCDGIECGWDGCGGSCGQCGEGQFCIGGQCPPAGKACEDGNATPWDGCNGTEIAEFILAGLAGDQTSVRLAAHPAGGYVATWLATVQGTNVVRLRRFLSTGQPAVVETTAFSTTAGQTLPALAVLGEGGTVAVWDGYQIDNNSRGVQARVFDDELKPLGLPMVVNTTPAGDQDTAAVAALPGNRFVVVWESGGDQDGSSTGIIGRVYEGTGTALTEEFQINTFTYAAQYGPAVGPLGTGFAVAWNSVLQDGASGGVYGQRFTGDFEPAGEEILVNLVTANNQRDPALSGWSNGFRVAWESNNQDGSNWGIFARGFSGTGLPASDDVQVNANSVGEQRHAALSCDSDGVCVVAWRHEAPAGYESRLRWLLANGQPDGEPLISSVAAMTLLERPSVALLVNGDVVVAWTGDGYGTGTRVVARRYGPDGGLLYH